MPSDDGFEPFPTDAAFVTNGQNADLTDLRCGHEKSEFAETKAVKMGGKREFAADSMEVSFPIDCSPRRARRFMHLFGITIGDRGSKRLR